MNEEKLKNNLKIITQELEQLNKLYNTEPFTVNLVAVSKTFPAEYIKVLHSVGQKAFGESYITEFKNKATLLNDLDIEWHFIGPLQSNKLKYIAQYASWVHSIEKSDHVVKLNQIKRQILQISNNVTTQSSKNIPYLNILIEVNISDEPNKHGVKDTRDVLQLAQLINTQEYLKLRGLMGIASNTSDEKLVINQFNKLHNLFKYLKLYGFPNIDTLSMGMSNDYISAIKSGTNMVRIGSKIFGDRN